MNFEIEVKFRVETPKALRARLQVSNAQSLGVVSCVDHYLAHPSRDLATTDEALRLRCEGDENRITYKGPKRAGPTKTREEIEVGYEPGDASRQQMRLLFARLGFTPVASVAKTRWTYAILWNHREMTVVVDEAPGLGWFAEVEAVAEGESSLPQAQQDVLELARHVGLTEVEPRSYLRMILEARDQPDAGPA